MYSRNLDRRGFAVSGSDAHFLPTPAFYGIFISAPGYELYRYFSILAIGPRDLARHDNSNVI
jgi:hypothetical protein